MSQITEEQELDYAFDWTYHDFVPSLVRKADKERIISEFKSLFEHYQLLKQNVSVLEQSVSDLCSHITSLQTEISSLKETVSYQNSVITELSKDQLFDAECSVIGCIRGLI